MVGVLWGEGKPGGLRRAGEGQSLGAPLGAVGGGGVFSKGMQTSEHRHTFPSNNEEPLLS